MKFEIKDCVQRGHYFAIVDEVDSILIDEARTPLIISGPTDQTTDKYARVRKIIPQLQLGEEIEYHDHKRQQELGIQLGEGQKFFTGDYIVDEKQRTIGVTDEGWVTIEKAAGHRQHRRRRELGTEALRRDRHQGPCTLQARRGIRGQGRRGDHR